jgi:hypothetical protein
MTEEITLEEIKNCDETVEVNKKAIEKLKESNALRKTGYAAERVAKRNILNALE